MADDLVIAVAAILGAVVGAAVIALVLVPQLQLELPASASGNLSWYLSTSPFPVSASPQQPSYETTTFTTPRGSTYRIVTERGSA